MTSKPLVALLLGATFIPCAFSGSVYLGFSQTQQQSYAGDRVIEFAPSGHAAQFSFEVSEQFSISINQAKLSDSQSLANNIGGAFSLKSWGLGFSYDWQHWSILGNYASLQDDLSITLQRNELSVFTQQSKSPTSAIAVAYNWDLTAWQLGLMAGLHYGDWQLKQQLNNPQSSSIQSSKDQGSSSFASLNFLFARFVTDDLMLGGSLAWNQLLTDESEAISRNGRNISQISNRILAQRLAALAISGTESYGQFSVYASYNIAADWLIDIDATADLGSDQNSLAWSLNVGYLF